jgi:hypothetical protein
MGGVSESSAGNVVNSQPHAPRLIRVGTPPSIFVYTRSAPGKDSESWLGVQGAKPLGGCEADAGVRGEAPILTSRGANNCFL